MTASRILGRRRFTAVTVGSLIGLGGCLGEPRSEPTDILVENESSSGWSASITLSSESGSGNATTIRLNPGETHVLKDWVKSADYTLQVSLENGGSKQVAFAGDLQTKPIEVFIHGPQQIQIGVIKA